MQVNWWRVTRKRCIRKNISYFGKYVTFKKSQMTEKSLEMFTEKLPSQVVLIAILGFKCCCMIFYGFLIAVWFTVHLQWINTPQWSCVCGIFENISVLVTSLNKQLHGNQKSQSTPHDLIETSRCGSNNKLCMNRYCESCLSTKLDVPKFVDISINLTSCH